MESMIDLDAWLEGMVGKVRAHTDATRELAAILADDARRLTQHDQAACLRSLKARLTEEVEHFQRMETAAYTGYSQGKLISGLAAFAIGGLFGAASGRKDPVSAGWRLAKSVLDKNVPFHIVLIAVGKEGIPQDVRVIPISRLARDSNTTESNVKAALKNGGCLLMTPDTVTRVLSDLESRVLDGSVSLPVSIEELGKEMSEGVVYQAHPL